MTCVCDAVPLLTGLPPRVATKTPEPVAVGAVTVAVYVPLALSMTAPIVPVPDCLVIVTVDPPEVRLLPLESLAWTVKDLGGAAVGGDTRTDGGQG